MALYFRLMVNDEHIGTFVAQRRERLEDLSADQTATYDVELLASPWRDARKAVIRHCYDDGAWALVQAALAALTEVDERADRIGGAT